MRPRETGSNQNPHKKDFRNKKAKRRENERKIESTRSGAITYWDHASRNPERKGAEIGLLDTVQITMEEWNEVEKLHTSRWRSDSTTPRHHATKRSWAFLLVLLKQKLWQATRHQSRLTPLKAYINATYTWQMWAWKVQLSPITILENRPLIKKFMGNDKTCWIGKNSIVFAFT